MTFVYQFKSVVYMHFVTLLIPKIVLFQHWWRTLCTFKEVTPSWWYTGLLLAHCQLIQIVTRI